MHTAECCTRALSVTREPSPAADAHTRLTLSMGGPGPDTYRGKEAGGWAPSGPLTGKEGDGELSGAGQAHLGLGAGYTSIIT